MMIGVDVSKRSQRSGCFRLVRLLCSLAVLALATKSTVLAEQFHVQNWRREDGLPDGQITAINQTPDGYLWIGTAKGLAQFDGVRFKVFTASDTPSITDSRISSLTTDRAGALWVGMMDGNVARFGKDGFAAVQPAVPLKLSPEQKRIPDTWLWDRRMAMVEEAEGTLRSTVENDSDRWSQLVTDGAGAVWWHVTGLGLMRFQAGQWSVFTKTNGLPPVTMRQAACDREGRAWFEAGGQLYPFPGGQSNSVSSITPLNGQRLVFTSTSKGGLLVVKTRSSWLQDGGQMWRFTDGQWHAEPTLTPPSPSPASAVITCLLEDRTGRVWCGTTSGGVFYADTQGRWQRLHPQNSFSQGYISCLFEDRLGNLWVGTAGDGLYRITMQPVTMLTLPPAFENAEVNTTCATRDGSVWMGTGGSGAIKYDGIRFTSYGKAEGLTNLHVCTLFEDSQTNLWAGTSGGLFRWQDGHFARVAGPPELSVWVKSLFEDRAGRLWIGTLAGLICFERGQFNVYYLQSDRRHCDIRCMAEDPAGNLWIGTIGEGLFKIPGGQADKLQRVLDFNALDARAMYCSPDGTLWIGGWGSGLFKMQNGQFKNFTTEDGLASDRIQSILSDATGQVWLSSDNGIIRVPVRETQNYQRGKSPPLLCPHLSLNEGLANGGCSGSGQPVATRTADGRLWFPNYEGIAVLDPRKVNPDSPTTKVLVESVLADGRELISTATGQWEAPSGVRRFEFDFSTPNLAAQQNMRFRHNLTGMDHDWIYGGEQRAAYYSQLPQGHYEFHVEVGGGDNQWHSAGQVIQLRIVPRFWERRWLQVLVSALAVVLVGGGIGWSQRRKYRLRVERLQMQNAMENERRRIARDLHDDFGSSLTGIALQGEAAALGGKIPAPAHGEIVSMTHRVRQLIGKLDEVVWATNPANDSLANFVAYVCDYAEEFLSPTNIHCRLESPGTSELPTLVLDAKTRHNLLLATKEALNNAVKHSNANKVLVKIFITPQTLALEITDDGLGIDLNQSRSAGNGLNNIRSRMELIHGSAEIQSQSGKGTTVKLTILLPKIGTQPRTNH